MKLNRRWGILGGGQLGRMSALAAARFGIETFIFTDEHDCPAAQVASHVIVGSYTDKKALKAFAEQVDVISYEFENIPVETVRYLQQFKPVHPDDRLLEIAQDRTKEKKFLNDVGIATTRWAAVNHPDQLISTLQEMGITHCILKTTRFGYDGKGQIHFRLGDDIYESWAKLGSQQNIIEELVDFSCEISVIIARDKLGQMAHYPPVLNEHRNHILSRTLAPAPIPEALAEQAIRMTQLLAEAVDLVGVMALELFVTRDGRILANEIAPRTHNSGHWTIDACTCSQFEQHVRTVCGLTVGNPMRHHNAIMHNVIGEDVLKIDKYLEQRDACIHLYGKREARPGRKMGHVTILVDSNTLLEQS